MSSEILEKILSRAIEDDGGAQILQGSVGWEDEDDYFYPGSGSEDGYTLVRVQLFEGRDYTKGPPSDRAQGYKIVCHLSGGLFRIPPKDTRVLVAVQKGMEHVPGAGVIIATIEKNPSNQFGQKRVKMDFGADYDLVIKARSVTITDYENQQVSLGPEGGLQMFDKEGAGIQCKAGSLYGVADKMNFVVHADGSVKSLLNMTTDGATLVGGGDSMIKMKAGQCTISTGTFVANSTIVMLGKNATPLNFAAIYPLAGPTPMPSTSVWISV